MDVFALRNELVAEYEQFSRSFVNIRTEDISNEVDAAYGSGHFWPAPLVQLDPNFEPGGYIDDLVADGTLDSEYAKVFRFKRGDNTFDERLLLHRHQVDAVEIAKRKESSGLSRRPNASAAATKLSVISKCTQASDTPTGPPSP